MSDAKRNEELRAITLHQPWASLVAVGAKSIETRSWSTKYRGRLLIHAAKRVPYPEVGPMFVGDFHAAQDGTWLHGPGVNVPMPFGAVVASCVLTDCVPMVSDYDDVASAYEGPAALEITPNGTLLLYPEWASALEDHQLTDVSDQYPVGDFTAGRYAWLLGDVQPTPERCPRCWGEGMHECEPFQCPCHAPEWCADVPGVGCDLCRAWHGDLTCPTCRGDKVCDPVPMRGKQGLWRPTWES